MMMMMMMMRLKTSFNQSLYMFLQRRLLTTLVVAAMFLLFSYIFKKKLLKYEKFRNLDNSACLHYRPKTHLFALLSKFLNFSYFSYAIMCYENRKFYAKKTTRSLSKVVYIYIYLLFNYVGHLCRVSVHCVFYGSVILATDSEPSGVILYKKIS